MICLHPKIRHFNVKPPKVTHHESRALSGPGADVCSSADFVEPAIRQSVRLLRATRVQPDAMQRLFLLDAYRAVMDAINHGGMIDR